MSSFSTAGEQSEALLENKRVLASVLWAGLPMSGQREKCLPTVSVGR